MYKSAKNIISQEYGHARNFITPNVIRIGKINKNIAYELSTGKGIFDLDLWGVSVVTYNPIDDTTDRHAIKSSCFSSNIFHPILSTSTTDAPHFSNKPATVDFPLPTPPVSPIIIILKIPKHLNSFLPQKH